MHTQLSLRLSTFRTPGPSWSVKGWPLFLTLETLSSGCWKGSILDIFHLTLRSDLGWPRPAVA